MTNISLTQRCNRSCSYCFAQDAMRIADRTNAFMTWADFERALDFSAGSACNQVKLLGGEPTIHPQFCRMVERARGRGLRVLVLTGGLIPERVLCFLEQEDEAEVSLLLNVIPPAAFSRRERERQTEVMSRLGPKVALGLNIDSPATPLDFLFDLIEEHNLAKTVRLGLAHPIVGGRSDFLSPKHYPAVGRRVAQIFPRACRESVHIEFDCGWVPCMFPAGFLEDYGITPEEVGLRCNPIMDLLPGGEAISCYPLATIAREKLTPDRGESWLHDRFQENLKPYRPMKLYKHCDSCSWLKQGKCLGGCIAGSMTRLRGVERVDSCHE